jgi:hypothetical protein
VKCVSYCSKRCIIIIIIIIIILCFIVALCTYIFVGISCSSHSVVVVGALCTIMKLLQLTYMQSSFWLSCWSTVQCNHCPTYQSCMRCLPAVWSRWGHVWLILLVTCSVMNVNRNKAGHSNGEHQPLELGNRISASIPHALRSQVNKISLINHPWEKDGANRRTHLSVILSTSCLLKLLSYSRSRNEIFPLLGCYATWIGG